jgi:hypothetical protein
MNQKGYLAPYKGVKYHLPELNQSKIIHACMALHKFIQDNKLADEEFDQCDRVENYMPIPSTHQDSTSQLENDEGEGDMNNIRDQIANALFARRM